MDKKTAEKNPDNKINWKNYLKNIFPQKISHKKKFLQNNLPEKNSQEKNFPEKQFSKKKNSQEKNYKKKEKSFPEK